MGHGTARRCGQAAAVAAAIAGAAPPALGQDEGATVLAPIVVTGAASTGTIGTGGDPFPGGQVDRTVRLGVLGAGDVFDVPVSVTTYTQETIENQQARTVVEVLKNDPSVSVFQNTNPGGTDDVYSIRGFLGSSGNTTFDGLFGLNFRQPAIEQIESVELVKGPSSLLYGQAGFITVGGNINLQPKRAGDEPLTEVTARYVSDSVFGLHADIGRRFGADGRFGVRVNGVYRDGATTVEKVDKRTGFGSAAFDLRLETVRATLDLDASDFRTAGYVGGTGIDPGFDVPDAPDGRNFWGSPDTDLDQDKRRIAARVEWDFLPGWTATVAGGQLDIEERYDRCGATIVDAAGDVSLDCGAGGLDGTNRAAEALARGVFSTGALDHRVSVGGSFVDSRFDLASVDLETWSSNIFDPTFPRVPDFPDVEIGGETSYNATRTLFANDQISFIEGRANLLLGLRATNVFTRTRDGVTGERLSRYDKTRVTPGVAMLVKPRKNVSIYANYLEGLEPGGIAPTDAANAGEALAPLVAKQAELGVKADFGTLGVTAALFQITRQNAFVDPTTNVFAADGEQRNRGVELALFGELREGLRLVGGATYLNGDLVRTAGGAFDGNDPIGVPAFQARVSGEWDMARAPGLTLTGAALYTSRQYADQANTQEIPDWVRFDLGARYTFDAGAQQVTLRAAVENVLDSEYWASVDRGFLYAAPSRTLLVSVTAAF